MTREQTGTKKNEINFEIFDTEPFMPIKKVLNRENHERNKKTK